MPDWPITPPSAVAICGVSLGTIQRTPPLASKATMLCCSSCAESDQKEYSPTNEPSCACRTGTTAETSSSESWPGMYGAPTTLTLAPVVIAIPNVTGPLPKPYLGLIRGARESPWDWRRPRDIHGAGL